MLRETAIIALTMGLVVGCDNGRFETALVRVNGTPVMAEEVRDLVYIKARIAELSGVAIPADQFDKWAERTAIGLVDSVVNSELLQQEMCTRKVVPAQADLEKTLSDYNRMMKKSAATPEELAKEFEGREAAFLRLFEQAVQAAAYRRVFWERAVPEKFVSQYLMRKTNELQRAERIDKSAREKASQAYERLQAGEKWAKVAADCSEDRLLNPMYATYANEWRAVGADAMGLKELAVLLPTMKKGDFTVPMETREGMIIFRFIGMKGPLYGLSRMLFRMAKPVYIEADGEEVQRKLSDHFTAQRKKETFVRLREKAKLEYPQGTNITHLVWKKEEMK